MNVDYLLNDLIGLQTFLSQAAKVFIMDDLGSILNHFSDVPNDWTADIYSVGVYFVCILEGSLVH